MNASRTARERARAELTKEITDAARRQLAEVGAEALSLRAVARELGMVSSALYRYFPSRDDLLTALIIDAYDAVGSAAERSAEDSEGRPPARRWREVCAAVRDWARAHVHEYALIYGSPVPGYRAPRTTVVPASRVPLALVALVRESWPDAAPAAAGTEPALPSALDGEIRRLAGEVAPELPAPVLARVLLAWTQLFGMVSFELFGHLVGSVDPGGEFFRYATDRMAAFVGLPA